MPRLKIKTTKPKRKNTLDLLALRRAGNLSQTAFWGYLGVTQSAGSRYESGRRLPYPVALLLDLVYVRAIDIAKVKGEDILILAYLRERHPDLHARLLRDVNAAANQRTRARRAGA